MNSNQLFYGALGLAGAGAMGVCLVTAGGSGLVFGFLAYMTLGGAAVCIWERSIVRSAFSLMGTFSGVAGLFVLLGSDFPLLRAGQLLRQIAGTSLSAEEKAAVTGGNAARLLGLNLSPQPLAPRASA